MIAYEARKEEGSCKWLVGGGWWGPVSLGWWWRGGSQGRAMDGKRQ